MRAWVLNAVGDIEYKDVDMPQIADDRVIVRVMAAGICGSDIPRVFQTGAHQMPLIPGHEFAGCVVAAGNGVDESWIGKRVGVFPLIPCRQCMPCGKGQYEMCRHYSYLGSRENGGFAEYVSVPEWNLIELSEQISYEAAAMLEPMAVSVHAMRRVDIRQNDTVVVCGLGTIGLLLTMFLKEQGVEKILVIGNKETQRQAAISLGVAAPDFLMGSTAEVLSQIKERTDGEGAALFFECVGNNETVSLAVEAVAAGGRVLYLGNPASNMLFHRDIYWKILRNQIQIMGSWNSSFTGEADDDWHYIQNCLERKSVAPENLITHRFSLEGLRQGLELMRDKTEEYIKVMVIP